MASILRSTALAAAAIACAIGCAPAHAELYKFRFKGRVSYNESFPDVPVGTKVVGNFVYDAGRPADYVYAGNGYDVGYHYLPRKYTLQLWFGEHSARAADSVRATMTDDHSGLMSDLFQMDSGYKIKIDGVLRDENSYFGISLASSPWMSDALTSTALPSAIDLDKFDRERYGYIITNGGLSYALLFSIDNIRSELCLNGTDPRTACDD